ncbi:MAG: transketolase [Amphiamblys sp. WSBS2006]|nr:MAG: transketolase [Amphiamblys sp. WSBS2006]
MEGETEAINTIRVLCAEMVLRANSGHPGAPIGLAPLAHTLFTSFLRHSPENPDWLDRDRFVLSNGHACTLHYVLLHLCGYDVTLGDLKAFRTCGSKTPGHPECTHTPGVEVTTGPLGQGIGAAVGLAIAQKHTQAVFNTEEITLFRGRTFVVVGDGCLMEGVASEAASLAGHLGLSNLVVIYDSNAITIDGGTSLAFTEDVPMRFRAYGFTVLFCENGDEDIQRIKETLDEAAGEKEKPTLIVLKTTIGYGSALQGTEKVHGSPLSADDIRQMKQKFNLREEAFHVPETVRRLYRETQERGRKLEEEWNGLFREYQEKEKEKGAELQRRLAKTPLGKIEEEKFLEKHTEPMPTRKAGGLVLEELLKTAPELFLGSADLSLSTNVKTKEISVFQKKNYSGRFVHFGVREHAMFAAANGIAAHGLFTPLVSTFLVFLPYGLGALRLAALSNHHVLYVMTHDSIGLGEDGPTHQPVETIASLRALPNVTVHRPADLKETIGAYRNAVEGAGPHVLCLSRQNTPLLNGTSQEKTLFGGYRVVCSASPVAILLGTGTEVALCVEASNTLRREGIAVDVVSMPSTTLFEQQTPEYRKTVLLPHIPVISVEALSTFGWSRYSHAQIGLRTFGVSGNAGAVGERLGITEERICACVRALHGTEAHLLPVLEG